MRVFRSLDEALAGFAPSAVTIGNFDGVHTGHRALMRAVVDVAHYLGVKPSVLTFHPHPATVVAPERTPRLLTTHEERCELMRAEGIEQVLILPFDRSVAQLEPGEFFERILVDTLGARAVTVGDDFHFGQKQAGQVRTLTDLGDEMGVKIVIVEAIRRRGVRVSSSEIRRQLASGNVSMVARLLERPYSLSGVVVPGEGRGSKQTVPTLNLDTGFILEEMAVPATGVYITRTRDLTDGRTWRSITNAGYRPTFGGEHITIETHLLEPLTGGSPSKIRVEFLRRVREERAFDSAEALRTQILADAARAETFFRRVSAAGLPVRQELRPRR